MAGYFARCGIAGGALLGALLTASTAALADTTSLICNGQEGPFTIDLNESQGMVTVNWPAKPDPATTPPSVIPGVSSGPLAAKFDARTIAFDHIANGWYDHYTIDRLTGALLNYEGINAPYDQATSRKTISSTCHVGTKQF